MLKAITEAVKGVAQFLDGHHQVVHLGKTGDFHLYSVLNVHKERNELDGANRAKHGAVYEGHLKRVHELSEYRANIGKSDNLFLPDPHAGIDDTEAAPYKTAAKEATDRLRNAGLPSQKRALVITDLKEHENQNTGSRAPGSVGGYWDRKKHVIAVERNTGDWHNRGPQLSNVLVHEWSHAFHDEMSKPQKDAWKQFYNQHVVGMVTPMATEEDRERYIKTFADTYAAHGNTRALEQQLKAREVAANPKADMLDSIHRSDPHWWEHMLKGGHLKEGVVAQTSHTRHAQNRDGTEKATIRKSGYVQVRALDPENPVDYAHMQRGYHTREDAKDLLAVSPLGKPHLVDVMMRHSLIYHPGEASSSKDKYKTHLLVDEKKTHQHAPEMLAAAHVRAGDAAAVRPGDHQAEAVEHYRLATDAKVADLHKASFPMSQEWRDEGELAGSEHKTREAYIDHLIKRSSNNVCLAMDEAHKKASESAPGVTNHAFKDHHYIDKLLGDIRGGAPVKDAAAGFARMNSTTLDYLPKNLAGERYHDKRVAAAENNYTFNSYGASNDQELFATTAENVALMHARKEPLPFHHRKLVKAWNKMVAGEPLDESTALTNAEKVSEKIARYLSRQ